MDIAIIHQTKKNIKGSIELKDYILIYGGMISSKHAAAGISVMMRNNQIDEIIFVKSMNVWYLTTMHKLLAILELYKQKADMN